MGFKVRDGDGGNTDSVQNIKQCSLYWNLCAQNNGGAVNYLFSINEKYLATMETLTYLYGSGLQMPLLELMFWIVLTMKNAYICILLKPAIFYHT